MTDNNPIEINKPIEIPALNEPLNLQYYKYMMAQKGHTYLFLLYRHAETNQNAGEIFQGAGLTCNPRTGENEIEPNRDYSLSENGEQQAQIAAKNCCNLIPDFIFCSPLKRAIETCDILRKKNNWTQPVQTLFDLHEVQVGHFEGESKPKMEKIFPNQYSLWRNYDNDSLNFYIPGDPQKNIPDGESKRTAAERFEKALATIQKQTPKKPEIKNPVIVAVTHGAVMRWYLRVCHKLNVKKVPLGAPLIVSSDAQGNYAVLGIGNYTIYEMKGEPVPAFPCDKQYSRSKMPENGTTPIISL